MKIIITVLTILLLLSCSEKTNKSSLFFVDRKVSATDLLSNGYNWLTGEGVDVPLLGKERDGVLIYYQFDKIDSKFPSSIFWKYEVKDSISVIGFLRDNDINLNSNWVPRHNFMEQQVRNPYSKDAMKVSYTKVDNDKLIVLVSMSLDL